MVSWRGTVEDMAINELFGGAYAGSRVLVTGHTGFKGSWLCLWLHKMGAEVIGMSLPPSTVPAHWPLLALDQVRELEVDLRDGESVRRAVDSAKPTIVFHLAAQALVRRGYKEPAETFSTNVIGLVNLLEALRDCASVKVLVNATTDKVYLEHVAASGYREGDALGGHDPYSTSKACAELISDCYRKSYFSGADRPGLRVATARAGNVIGGGDWAEDRLVPDLVRAVVAGTPLLLRNPTAIRPWQHVLDPLSGYLRLGQGLLGGEPVDGPWNFGPGENASVPVSALVDSIALRWPGLRCEPGRGPHPYEATTLRLDCSKSERELGWRPVWDAAESIAHTVAWYRAFHESGEILSNDDLDAYIRDARDADLSWAT